MIFFRYKAKKPFFGFLGVVFAWVPDTYMNLVSIDLKTVADKKYRKMFAIVYPEVKAEFLSVKATKHVMLEDQKCNSFKVCG